ncbi:MAG: hypothetical protein M3O01_03955 [Pseudomonadota bacterium]|nr:hypothetical protein [Pseudomonadota bacterium]
METTSYKPLGQDASRTVDKAADTAQGAIRQTQNVANSAMDRLSDKVDSARDQAAPLINRLSAQTQDVARKSADAVRETAAQLRDRAAKAQETTVGYIKDEPVKAMLIAAATGAALMALVSLASRSRD